MRGNKKRMTHGKLRVFGTDGSQAVISATSSATFATVGSAPENKAVEGQGKVVEGQWKAVKEGSGRSRKGSEKRQRKVKERQ